MKKIRIDRSRVDSALCRKTMLVMKLIFLFTLIFTLHVSAKVDAQTKVTLNLQDVKISRVFQEIEKKTEFRFLFDERLIPDNKKVSVKVKNEPVVNLLNNLLPNEGLKFNVTSGNLIIISDNKPGNEQQAVSETIIKGKVEDADGNPMKGVTISEKGTKNTVTTNEDGTYQITVQSANSVLVFTYVGYKAKEIAIGGRSLVSIAMETSQAKLEDVVVVGYGNKRKTDLTSSVATVKADDIAKNVASTPQLALQGRAPGVFVQANSGSPTARTTVRIRGVSTFLNAEPLYVVDGVPIFEYGSGDNGGAGSVTQDQRGPLNFFSTINQDDIESISVLKDGASAAIYGNRASNGVILITTKKGKKNQKPKIEFSMNSGVNRMGKTYEVLNTKELKTLIEESFANNPDPSFQRPLDDLAILQQYENTPLVDWQKEMTKKTTRFNNISARVYGGDASTTYSLGLGYYDNTGNFGKNDLKRYSLSTNFTSKISKHIEVGLINRFTYVKANDLINDNGISYNYASIYSYSPWQPVFDPLGEGGFAAVTTNGNRKWGSNTNTNGVALTKYNDYVYDAYRNIITGYAQIEIIDGLKLKASGSADVNSQVIKTWRDVHEYYFFSQNPDVTITGDGTSFGTYGEKAVYNTNKLFEYSLNYVKRIRKHSFDLFAAYTNQNNSFRTSQARNRQNSSREPAKRTLSGTTTSTQLSSFYTEAALISFLGRLSYNFGNKYLLDATFRRDGSSSFAPENRWGNFGGVSAAWRITSEKFMSGIKFLNELKLRAGYGVLGSQASVGTGAYLAGIINVGNTSFGSGNGNPLGNSTQLFFPTGIANRQITWETNRSLSVGFDAEMFDKKLTVGVDYYNRLTDGILQSVQLPLSSGAFFNPSSNVAKVRNSGFEFSASYQNHFGKVNYFVNANFTTVKNRVEKLNNGTKFPASGLEEGKPIGFIWGYESAGIIKTDKQLSDYQALEDKEIDPANASKLAKGDYSYVDQNKDGIIDVNDRVMLGKTIPGYYYGFTFGGDYMGFDLSIFFQGVGDVQTINPVRISGEDVSNGMNNRLRTALNHYTAENTNTDIPRAIAGDPLRNSRFSSRFVESGAFLRLKNVQLGYAFPANLIKKLKVVSGMRAFVSGVNLLTFTKYSGLDPEEQTANSGIPTVVPIAKTFTFGLSVNF
jgi:TonB-dependent starch-binding outer membrane protein SusC